MVSQNQTVGGHTKRCPGCYGSDRCWVCLGTGQIEDEKRHYLTCHRCGGSGDCPEFPEVVADEPVA